MGVERGSEIMFSDFATGGPMWTGTGRREARVAVRFDRAFAGMPVVFAGLGMIDAGSGPNLRMDVGHEHVTAEGFDLVLRTWEDTRLARVRAEWMAIGPLPDPDRWDVG
jgi:hypothetical protein